MSFPREGIDPNLVLAWLDDDEQRLFRACECSDLETTINVRVRLPEWTRRREKLPTTPGQEERQAAASKMLNDCFEAHANPRWIFQRLAQARRSPPRDACRDGVAERANVEPKSSPVATVGDLKIFLASVPDDLPIDRCLGDGPMAAVVRPFRPACDEDPYVVEGCGLRLVFVEYDDWYEPSDE